MSRRAEVRWTVFKDYYKDYYKDDTNFTDTWCVLYSTKDEAEALKARLEAGVDKSWFDVDGNDYAGHDAFLYVDQIVL